MGNEIQANFASTEQMQKEADSLIAGIVFKQLANEKIQERILAFTETVLLGDEDQGKIKRWAKQRMVNMMPRMFSIMNNRLDVDDEDIAADIGKFLSLQLMIRNNEKGKTSSADNIEGAREVAGKIDNFLSNLDFGLLYESVEGTGKALAERTDIIKSIIMDKHTGKLAALTPTLMVLFNNMLGAMNVIFSDHKDMPPDFIALLTAGLINNIDGETLGKVINNRNEMPRLLNIGNKFEREGEVTLFELAWQNKTTEIMKEIDPSVFMKMKTAKAELKEAFDNGLLQALQTYPELIKKSLEADALVGNAENRTLKQKLLLVSKLSDEDLVEGVSGYINAKNTGDMADVANLVVALLGKIQEKSPGVVGGLVANILSSIDTGDLAEVCGPIVQEVLEAAGPVLAPVMPQLLNGVCDTLEMAMDEQPDEMPKTLSRLASILNNGGGK